MPTVMESPETEMILEEESPAHAGVRMKRARTRVRRRREGIFMAGILSRAARSAIVDGGGFPGGEIRAMWARPGHSYGDTFRSA